jgi:hypothetical protein
MALSPAFTISQSALSPSNITATDTSTGSDGAITSRRIYFQTSQGTYLVESGTSTDYEVWSYSDSSETFNVLTTDQALSITVQWLDVSNNVLYSLTQVFCLSEFNQQFFYYLIQQQALTPNIIQDSNYFSNIANYWMNITGAIQAIEIGADVSASQNCLNRATYMMDNQANFF